MPIPWKCSHLWAPTRERSTGWQFGCIQCGARHNKDGNGKMVSYERAATVARVPPRIPFKSYKEAA